MELNKIYNGDCFNLIKDIEDNSIDCIYTDVPYLYNMGEGGAFDVSARIKKRNAGLADTGLDKGFDYSLINDFMRVMKKVNLYIWCSKLQIFDIANYVLNYASEHSIELFYEILVWNKPNPTPATNNTWLPDVEYCLYFREKGVKLNDGYDIKHKCYNGLVNKKDKDSFGHPTIKPLECVENHLLHTTQPNDVVLDPFIGSGTTAVACKEIGRNYIGFEIDKDFFNKAQDRLNGITVKVRNSEGKRINLF